MSRITVTGKKFEVAFGVDHYTGVFVQIWNTPSEEQDCSFFKIDNFGIDCDESKVKELPDSAQRYIKGIEEQLKNNPGCHIGQEHIIGLARRLNDGLPDISRDVYRVFGDVA